MMQKLIFRKQLYLFFSNKNSNYLKACTNSDKSFVTISQKSVEDLNKFLREEKFAGYTDENLYQSLKNYSISGNDDPVNKYELSSYIKVDNPSCYKTITVGELMEKGLITDSDGMCNKSSLIVIYRRADAKNTAGIIDAVQETGICKSDYKTERGPVITITPFSDLSYSSSKEIKVNVTTESTKLKNSFTMQYGWSKNDRKKPSSWQNLEFTDNTEEKASASLTINELDEVKYLWIKGGTELDNKRNKTSDMVAGPYAFLAAPWVTYDLNGGETGDCPEKKQVVYTREYGKNTQGINEYLCTPTKPGYDFAYWTYKDTNKKITNTSIVNDKTDHYLKANWKAKTFVITLDKNGGTVAANPTSLNIQYDSNVLDPTNITLPKREYKVTGFGLAASRLSDGATVSSNSPLTSTYAFKGWYTTKGGTTKLLSEESSPVLQPNISDYTDELGNWKKEESTTAYAKWEDNSVTLPTITKNKRICGWTKSSSGTTIEYNSGAIFVPTADTVIYGVCDYCEYQISYNKNNGSATNTMANSTCKIDNNCTLRANAFALSGYTFNGWNTASNKTGTNYKNRASVASLASTCNQTVTLYANWCRNCTDVEHGSCSLNASEPGTCTYTTGCDEGYEITSGANTYNPTCTIKKYLVTVEKGDGISTITLDGETSSNTLTKLVTHGSTINIDAKASDYYQFESWNGNISTKNKSIIVKENLTYTALGRKNTVTVEYYSNGGTLKPSKSQYCNKTACSPDNKGEYCDVKEEGVGVGDPLQLREFEGCTGNKTGFIYELKLNYDRSDFCKKGLNNFADINGATLYVTRKNYYPTYTWLIDPNDTEKSICEDKRGFKQAKDLLKHIDELKKDTSSTNYQHQIITNDVTVRLYAGWSSKKEPDCDKNETVTCP